MGHTKKSRKIDIIYSLISAGIYTLLYVIISFLEPGPGFQDSMVARFAILELLILAIFFVALYFVGFFVLGLLYCILGLVLTKLDMNEDDANCCVLGWAVSIPVVLYLSVALGLISIGVM